VPVGSTLRWEHFAHAADIGIRGVGPSPAEAFEQAGIALTAVITDPDHVRSRDALDITCAAPDMELLLVDWLNALIYEMATRHMLFSRYEVRINGCRLQAKVWGERIDLLEHAPAVEIKGATLTALKVAEIDGQWIAQCIVDV
jgi:SHS2 domain-containing protein